MSDWRTGELGELAIGIRGVSYTPDQLKEFKGPNTATLLRANNIQNGSLNFCETLIVPRDAVSDRQVMQTGDIAVCMSNGSKSLVGKAAPFVAALNELVTVGAFCSIFRPVEGADQGFVKYLFQSADYRRQLDFSLAGSAINNLRNSELQSFRVLVPPAIEQRGIAHVLDTLDIAIRQTEAIIEKLKQVKQGLLHDLLTRGLDDNGELRAPREQAPHLYKDSPLGWIPRGWRADTLQGVIDEAPRNGIYKPPAEIGFGTLLVGQTAFTPRGSLDFENARRARVSSSELDAFGLAQGDILVSRVFATREGVGQPALVPLLEESAVYESNMMRLRVKGNLMLPSLLFHWLKHRTTRAWVTSRAFASNQASINRDTICGVPVPVPSIDEQRAILSIELAHEQRLDAEISGLNKTRELKAGLMDDLLTGRVRVTPQLT